MRSYGHLFLPTLVTADLRCVIDSEMGIVSWGWKVSDFMTQEPVWICSHPAEALVPSGRWLARSLLEGTDIVKALVGDEPFPPKCHQLASDEDAGAVSRPSNPPRGS